MSSYFMPTLRVKEVTKMNSEHASRYFHPSGTLREGVAAEMLDRKLDLEGRPITVGGDYTILRIWFDSEQQNTNL